MKKLLIAILAICLISVAYGALEDNLISHYSADDADTSGTTAIDALGNYNATLSGGVVTGVAGIRGEGYYFDGINTEMITAIPISYYYTTSSPPHINLTICAWITPALLRDDNVNSFFGNSKVSNAGFKARFEALTYSFTFDVDGGQDAIPLYAQANTNYYVCLVSDDNTYYGYINGTDVTQSSLLFGGQSDSFLRFGNAFDYTISGLNGTMDEMSLWDRALSPSEIAQLYNSGRGLCFDGSVFSDCGTHTFYDDFGNGDYTTEGWSNWNSDPQESNGMYWCNGEECMIAQNFTQVGIDPTKPYNIEWNSSTMTNVNVYYTKILLQPYGVGNGVSFSIDIDTLDSFTNDDVWINCYGSCTCYGTNTSTSETILHNGKAFIDPDTNSIRVVNLDNNLEVTQVITGCNISEFGQFIAFDRYYEGANFTDFLITDIVGEEAVPVVTLITPADHTTSNLPLDVTYNTTHDGSCGIYIDGILNQTDANVENSTTQYFNVTLGADGTYHYYVNCTIGGTDYLSEERHYHYHASSPLILMYQPNHDNTTIFTTFNLTWIGNITNGNLTFVNETIRNSTNDILYNNEQTPYVTFLDLAKNIDATAWGNGYYYYFIDTNDEAMNPSQEYILFQIDVCIPDWVCSGYDACQTNDTQNCNAVTDVNMCGEAYGGDYSEFSGQSCNYCTPTATSTPTNFGNGTCQYDLLMTNWAACCDVTGIATDCLYTFTTPSVTINFTASDSATEYAACSQFLYDSNDLSSIAIDGLGKFGVALVAFASVIAIGLFISWVIPRLR